MSETNDESEPIHEPRLWRDNGWTARVICSCCSWRRTNSAAVFTSVLNAAASKLTRATASDWAAAGFSAAAVRRG